MNAGRLFLVTLLCAASSTVYAQEPNPTAQPQQQQPIMPAENGNGNNVPLYRIQVVGRDIPAINYWHRSGSTKIGFAGTSLLPQGKGEANVTSKGQTFINAKFQGFVPANSFGVEYLTYVLWAITPQGRPVNLGEVMPGGSKAEMNVTTNLQQFALIVTAEPYFAVTTPSDLVVMQNTVTKDKTTGIIDTVNVHFNLLPRGAYVQTAGQHADAEPGQTQRQISSPALRGHQRGPNCGSQRARPNTRRTSSLRRNRNWRTRRHWMERRASARS